MIIRAPLVAAITILSASVAFAATGTMLTSSFGCPSANDTWASNALWKSKGYDAAWKAAKPKGCLPFSIEEQVSVIYGGDDAKCAVRQGEMGPCLWIQTDTVKLH
jgi:hypothetical protein